MAIPYTFTAGGVIVSDQVDANFAVCVLTQTAGTITVTHTWTASQTFTGGFTTGAAMTLGGNLLFTDATYDIGASGATRPRDFYLSRNAVLGGTLAIGGALTGVTTAACSGLITSTATTGIIASATATATPSAYSATQGTFLASTVSGAALMGFGTTNDVSLMNRAGTVCLGVGPNTTTVNLTGALTYGGVTLSAAVTGTGNMVLSAVAELTTATFVAGLVIAGALSGVTTLTTSSTAYIGDTANGDVTLGLTINQAGNDNQIIAFKSSDVAHGVTTLMETDTFGSVQKLVAASGGMYMHGVTAGNEAFLIRGVVTTEDATRTTAAVAPVELTASLKSGTTTTTMSADRNLAVITNNGTTQFIFDSDGSGHANIEWVAF